MNNFVFQNSTKIYFGKNQLSHLAEEIKQYGSRVLMAYGGGSIKRNGVYELVLKALGSQKVVEFGGIEPNPKYETCMKAVEICKAEGIDFLLSVGGGSTLDGT